MKKQNKGFNNKSYVEMLKNRAIPSMKLKYEQYCNKNNIQIDPSNVIFIQDNASFHNENKNKPELESAFTLFKSIGVEIEEWPPKSPDLNISENGWSLLDGVKCQEYDKLKQNQIPKNKKEAFIFLKRCWDLVDNQKVINCYNSYLDRLKRTIEKGGNNNFNYSRKRKQ